MEVIMSGVITQILPAQQGTSQRTGQPWVSQEYLLCHEQGQYPRYVCFRVFGEDKIKQMNIQLNEQLTVHLNINAQQGQKGYFNSIDCWKVDRQPMQQYTPQGYAPQPTGYAPAPSAPTTDAAPFPPQPTTAVPQQPAPAPFPPQQSVAQPTPQAPVQPVAQPQQGGLPFPPAQ